MVRQFTVKNKGVREGGYAAEGGGAAGKGAGRGKGSDEEAPSVKFGDGVKGLGGKGSVPRAEAAPAGDLSRMAFKGTSDETGEALKLYIPVQYQKGDDRRFYAAWIPS